jgi:hypothetical protein
MRRGSSSAATCSLDAVRLQPIRETGTERDFDVVRTMRYRSELFGRPFSEALQRVMRGPSEWSAGERELFAAFVSARNRCLF